MPGGCGRRPQLQATRRGILLGVAAPTVAKTVTRLERKGLVSRQKPTEDRRSVLVILTESGHALRPPVEQIWTELEDRTLRSLTSVEQQTLKDLMIRLIGNFDRPE